MFRHQRRIMNLKLAMITALLLVALVLGACTGAGTDTDGGDIGEATPTLLAPDDTGGAGEIATVEPTAETQ